MGGFRTDGKLLEKLQEAVEILYASGYDSLSDDVEEAIARLSMVNSLGEMTEDVVRQIKATRRLQSQPGFSAEENAKLPPHQRQYRTNP